MNKTVLTHFYNEEYLLPWWLDHHKKYFDHGILIDYASTDRSVEIIKEICPTWTVVKSKNEFFEAKLCDEEIIDYESTVPGWKIALNITEFLVGDYSILTDKPNQYYIMPCCVMIDDTPDIPPNNTLPLIKQKFKQILLIYNMEDLTKTITYYYVKDSIFETDKERNNFIKVRIFNNRPNVSQRNARWRNKEEKNDLYFNIWR